MKVFIVLAVALISVASASHRGKPEFYWREFYGKVPSDALKVSQEGSEDVGYIAQGYFEGVGLLPGMVKDGVMELVAVAKGEVLKITTNIKIMCTDSANPETDFQWISVHYQNLENLGNLHFLTLPVGGTETSTDLYIGRHSEPDYTNIGKIYTVEPYQGLTIPDKHGKVTVYKNFEVLAMLNFDCSEEAQRFSSVESEENLSVSHQLRLRSHPRSTAHRFEQ